MGFCQVTGAGVDKVTVAAELDGRAVGPSQKGEARCEVDEA